MTLLVDDIKSHVLYHGVPKDFWNSDAVGGASVVLISLATYVQRIWFHPFAIRIRITEHNSKSIEQRFVIVSKASQQMQVVSVSMTIRNRSTVADVLHDRTNYPNIPCIDTHWC